MIDDVHFFNKVTPEAKFHSIFFKVFS